MPEISRFVVSAKASVTGKKEPMSAQSQDTGVDFAAMR
jgi:hypothetical protein